MSIRQLSEDEKKLCNSSMLRLRNRNKHLQFYIKKTQLELDEGLQVSFEKTRDDYSSALREFKEELSKNEEQIKILTTQVRDGVEKKKEDSK